MGEPDSVSPMLVETVHEQHMPSVDEQQFRLGDGQASLPGEPQLYLFPGGRVSLVAAERAARVDEIRDAAIEGAFCLQSLRGAQQPGDLDQPRNRVPVC